MLGVLLRMCVFVIDASLCASCSLAIDALPVLDSTGQLLLLISWSVPVVLAIRIWEKKARAGSLKHMAAAAS